MQLEPGPSRAWSHREGTSEAATQRIEKAVDELDITIRQIRTAIFEMESPGALQVESVRAAVVERVREAATLLGFQPRVVFSGAVDSVVAGDVVDHLLATLQESLLERRPPYVSAHRRGPRHHRLGPHPAVRDDGAGIRRGGPDTGGHGLTNMRARAERLGGRFSIAPRSTGGTELEWRVPLVPPATP